MGLKIMTKQLTIYDLSPVDPPEGVERLYNPDEVFRLADESLLKKLLESCRIERKSASFSGDSLGEYICMWANTYPDGGVIIAGMSDNGEFEGCLKLSQDQVNKVESCYHVNCPDARVQTRQVKVGNKNGELDFVILTRVHYNNSTIVKTTKGKVFKRVSDKCVQLDSAEIRELEADKGFLSFEKQDVINLEYPDAFKQHEISKFADLARVAMRYAERLSEDEVLELRHLGRLKNGKFIPNYACVLLFAKDPRGVIPGCRIHFKRFEDIRERTGKEYNPVKDELIEGTIAELIQTISDTLESQLRVYRPLNSSGKFFPIAEYPKEAWTEAIVNACVHRSYGNGMKNIPIYVKMFDDRLEVESPGPFPPQVTPANIYYTHNPRNPHLMDALRLLEFTRMSKEGCQRIKDTMLEMSLPEPIFEQDNRNNIVVRVTLKNRVNQRRVWIDHYVTRIVSDALAAMLTEDEKQIINWTAEHPRISISDASRLIKSTWHTAQRILIGLARKRILQYVRFQPFVTNQRDAKAYFRITSNSEIDPGGFIQSTLDKDDAWDELLAPSSNPGDN